MKICVYTHTPCRDGCNGADEDCHKCAHDELEQSREYFAAAGGYNIAREKLILESTLGGWANYEQYERYTRAYEEKARKHASLLECLKATTKSFLNRTGIPPQMIPPADYAQRAKETKAAAVDNQQEPIAPKAMKAAHRCPSCKRPIADNLQYCGRPTCWRKVHGPIDNGEGVQGAVDAMHRQRGCGPFSLRWNWRNME